MMDVKLDVRGMMEALAELKQIPLAKVVRNAARDFVQAAFRATPTAKVGRAQYYRAKTNGRTWYIPVAKTNGRRVRGLKKSGVEVRKVAIRRGWSRSTWLGAMQALGMASKARPARMPEAVERKSTASSGGAQATPSVVISDEFRLDNFGYSTTIPQYNRIAGEGFKLAAKRLAGAFKAETRKAWGDTNA